MADGTEALQGTETGPPPADNLEYAQQQAASAPPVDTQATPSQGSIAPVSGPAAPAAPAQDTMPRRTGVAGILDAVADMLAPRTNKVSYAADGTRQVSPGPVLSTKQKFAIAGVEALKGAARGMATPAGPNQLGRATAAGIQGGFKDAADAADRQDATAQEEFDRKQKARTNELNYQLGMRNLTKSDLELKAMGVKASQDQVTFSNSLLDREKELQSYDLGTGKDAGSIADLVSKLPKWEQELYRHEGIQAIPVYGSDGERQGVQFFLRKPNVDTQPVASGTQLYRFQLPSKPGESASLQPFNPAAGTQQGDADKINKAALTQYNEWQKGEADAKLKASEAAKNGAEAGTQGSVRAKNFAEANKANADANKASADASKTRAETVDDSTIDAIGTGKITVARLDYLLSRNPEILQRVTAKYPNFDTSKASSYTTTYKEYTKTTPGSAGAALNAGGTALKHLQELQGMNTAASHIYGTPAYNAYANKADTVASELAKFYGDATIPAIAAIKSTLAATLPGNRDAAIRTQAKSMGDKLDSYEQGWRNAAPSEAYEAPMPGIDAKAKEARAALDPDYKARLVTEQQGQQPQQHQPQPPAQAQPQQKPPAPQGMQNPVYFKDSHGDYHWIPSTNLQAAKQRDPQLQVIQ